MFSKIRSIIALGTSLIIAVQIGIILVSGNAACPNEACEIVGQYTTITPLGLNILGLLYFLSVFWILRRSGSREGIYESVGIDWPGLLLLAGLAGDTVLFAFQVFVVQKFCGYCLLILGLVLTLNLLGGKKQVLAALALALAVLISFSMLSFQPVTATSRDFSLEDGVFGTRTCAAPSKQIYLIFSKDCPHCLRVLESLESCNSCNLHLNPIDHISNPRFADVQPNESYSPEVNRQILAMFGIEEIPVLLVDNQGEFLFIKGEEKIIEYIMHACFTQEPTIFLDHSQYSDQSQIKAFLHGGDDCSIDINCGEQGSQTSQP